MSNQIMNAHKIILPLLACTLLTACSGRPTVEGTVTATLCGVATGSGSPISGITVYAYPWAIKDGLATSPLLGASEQTEADGTWCLDVGSYSGQVWVVAKGGAAQFAEVSDSLTTLGISTELRALVMRWDRVGAPFDFSLAFAEERKGVVISLFSELAMTYAETRLRNFQSPDLHDALSDSFLIWREHLEADFWGVVPAVLTEGPVGTLDERAHMGVLNAALSHQAARIGIASTANSSVSSLRVLEELQNDLADATGKIDGKGLGDTPLRLGNCPPDRGSLCTLSGRFLRAEFAQSAADWLASDANTSGLVYAGDIENLFTRIAERESPLFPLVTGPLDDTPPALVIEGLADSDLVKGLRGFTVTAKDTIAMGSVNAVRFERTSTQWVEGESNLLDTTDSSPDPKTRVKAVTVDTTRIPDGPLDVILSATDAAGNTTTVSWTLHVDNSPASVIAGTFTLATRVDGAIVRVFDSTGGTVGDELGSGVTDDAGHFVITLEESSTATALLLTARKPPGVDVCFEEQVVQATICLSDDDVFESVIGDFQDGVDRVVEINGWTHIGTAFARGLWSTVYRDVGSFSSAIEDAFELLEGHVNGDGGSPIRFRSVRPALFTVAAEVASLNAQARFGLLNAGVGALAHQHALDTFTTSGVLNTVSLYRLLAQDLEATGGIPPLWDGLNTSGALAHGRVLADSYFTRLALAIAMVNFVTTNENDASAFTEADVLDFLDSISMDDEPRLYPTDAPPLAYDLIAPTIAFVEPTRPDGEVTRGNHSVAVEAADNRRLRAGNGGREGLGWIEPLQMASVFLQDNNTIAGPWLLTGVIPLEDPTIAEGALAIRARAVDEGGHETVVVTHIVVDRIAPSVAITTTTAGGVPVTSGAWTSAATLDIAGTATDANPLAVDYRWAGGAWTGVGIAGAAFSLTALPLSANTATTLEIRASDGPNQGTASFTLNHDEIAPVVTVVQGTINGSTVLPANASTNAAAITVSGTVVEANAGTVEFNWNATGWNPVTPLGENFVLANLPFSPGQNSLEVRAVDRAGNVGAASIGWFHDNIPPVVTITSATAGGVGMLPGDWTGSPLLTIVGTATDANPLTARYRLNGGSWAALPVTGDAWSIAGAPLFDGVNTLEVEAMDAVNVGSVSASYHRDAQPPVITVVIGTSGAFIIDESSYIPVITWTGTRQELTYDTTAAPAGQPLVSAMSFVKWADNYTPAGGTPNGALENLPEWRFTVSDNRTPTAAIVAEFRIVPPGGPATPWAALDSIAAPNYQRFIKLSTDVLNTINQVAGSYRLEYRARDAYGNKSATSNVVWTQTINRPALRAYAATTMPGSCDSSWPNYYTLASSRSGNGPCVQAPVDNGAGLVSSPLKLRIAAWRVDNPTIIPVRVRIGSATALSARQRRGRMYETPSTGATPWNASNSCGTNGIGDHLQNGTCYSLPWTSELADAAPVAVGNVLADTIFTDASGVEVPPCANCASTIREIQPGEHLWVVARSNSFSWLDPAASAAGGYGNVLAIADLPPVAGRKESLFEHCTNLRFVNGNFFCNQWGIRQAVRFLSRARVEFAAKMTIQSASGRWATFGTAPGLGTIDAPGTVVTVDEAETGYTKFPQF